MIHIVHYGLGNVGSIRNMLHRLGFEAKLVSEPAEIRSAKKLILPGVGSFDRGMEELHRRGLVDALNEKVLEERVPVLGVCLGMQLFSKGSEEGDRPGLGWIDAETVRLKVPEDDPSLRLPHMGWNSITVERPTPLLEDLPDGKRFYFVHTYHVSCRNPDSVAAHSRYGTDFTCAVSQGNIYGTQFHPEKSHRFGMKVLSNFATRC
jgi:imidazole glycerol-phosphate synthase subunit HisH